MNEYSRHLRVYSAIAANVSELSDHQVSSLIEHYAEQKKAEDEAWRQQFANSFSVIIEQTGSHIEIALGAHLLLVEDGHGNRAEFCADWDKRASWKLWTVLLGFQVNLGPYRADFVLEHRYKDRHITIVVECDGHEFHERTKEQVARDKARDRWMATRGIRVFRFSGSEIFRTPRHCIAEVEAMLSRLVEESMEICGSAAP